MCGSGGGGGMAAGLDGGGGGGGMGGVVLVEVILSLVDVLAEAGVLELAVAGGRSKEVLEGAGDLALVDLVGLVVEGGGGCSGDELGAAQEIRVGSLLVVGLGVAGLVFAVRKRIHNKAEQSGSG